MAQAQNPLMAELAQLDEQLRQAEARLTLLNNQRTALGLAPRWDAFAIQVKDREVQDQVAVVNRLKDQVKAKQEAIAALDRAAAEAVAQGLTPEAGYAKAIADQQRAKALTYIAIAVAVAIVLAAIWWFVKRKKA